MIVCSCGKKIEYFVAIAKDEWNPVIKTEQRVILSNGSFFLCGECADKKVEEWKLHNRSRTQPYLIKKAEVNVTADTKKEFIRRVSPQLFGQFEKGSWWLPKTDIHRAAMGTKKEKQEI